MIANRKVSKKQARAAAMKEKLRLEREAARNAAEDARAKGEKSYTLTLCVKATEDRGADREANNAMCSNPGDLVRTCGHHGHIHP